MADKPSPEELASFIWGGQRARPRKGIEGTTKTGETYLKPPGSLLTKWPGLGVAVEVECCADCTIYILDACERVQISECVNCRIVVGPTVGSLMLFECKGCTMTVASKQIRLRDCVDCEMRVFAAAHECVVIETSKKLRIGAWDVAYAGLAAQFASSGWFSEEAGAYVNHEKAIYDFSPPGGGGKNWSPVGVDPKGRWCELKVDEIDGLTGGKVSESRVDAPSLEGAECPCAAPDGTKYEAAWFSTAADTTKAAEAKKANAAAAAAAVPAVTKASPSQPKAAATSDSAAAAKPGLFARFLGWLTGKKSEPDAIDLGDVTIKGKQTQVCVIS